MSLIVRLFMKVSEWTGTLLKWGLEDYFKLGLFFFISRRSIHAFIEHVASCLRAWRSCSSGWIQKLPKNELIVNRVNQESSHIVSQGWKHSELFLGELTFFKKRSLNKSSVWCQLGLPTVPKFQCSLFLVVVGKGVAADEVCIPLMSAVSHYLFAESGQGCLVDGKW